MEDRNFCFVIKNAFGNMQCILCYQTFKTKKTFSIKRHFDLFHKEINKLKEEKRKMFFLEQKNLYMQKIKEWVLQEEQNDEILQNKKLKMEISSQISLEIAQQGRPFMDGMLAKNILQKTFQTLNYRTDFIKSIPLSPQTVDRRIAQIGNSVESSIKEKLINCKFLSFCLDESTDIKDLCQLVVCVRCIDEHFNVFESMLTLETFYGHVTGKLLMEVVSDKLFSIVDVNKIVGVCTDGANVMVGKNTGLIGNIKKSGMAMQNFHCIIHQAALASKFITQDSTMKAAEHIINKIRGGHNALTHRKFVKFLTSINAAFNDLKMFTEVRWLSRGDCLNRLYDLKEEVLEFLVKENIDESAKYFLKDTQFISDLAFLADTTSLLNDFNLELQGKGKNISDICKILFNFKTKLFLILCQIKSDDFSSFKKTSLLRESLCDAAKTKRVEIFDTLLNSFEDRFADFKSIQLQLDLFNNPYNCDVTQYEFDIQSEIIFLRTEVQAPGKMGIEFWKNLNDFDFPELKRNALKLLSLFPSTYCCEQIFSDLKFICSKQRNKLSSSNLKHILLIRNCYKILNLENLVYNA